jgi:hypothetical protein
MRFSCIIGGLILPLVLARRLAAPEAPRSFWYWLLPNYRLVPTAFLASVWTLPERLGLVTGTMAEDCYWRLLFREGSGEFMEWCFAVVMMLYFLSIWRRAVHLSED